MTDVETLLRTQLHDRLDDLDASSMTAQLAVRSGRRVQRRRTALVAASAVAVLLAGGATAVTFAGRTSTSTESVTPASGLAGRSLEYVEQFRNGDFTSIRADMTPFLRSQLSETALRDGWQAVVADRGALTQVGDPTATTETGDVTVALQFERGAMQFRVFFDTAGNVTGVRIYSNTPEPRLADAFKADAHIVVDELDSGRFADVYDRFDTRMAKALPVAKLRKAWQDVAITGHGGVVSIGAASHANEVGGNLVIDVFCTMHKGDMKVRISFNETTKEISGLYFLEP